MSGGSHSYLYCRIEEEYVGRMHDRELDDLMQDIVTLVHDLEWYDSADKVTALLSGNLTMQIGEETYK